MQYSTHTGATSHISLGKRRGKPDLAGFALDLGWASAASASANLRAYPSPPMSGSPPLPSRNNPGSSDRGHGSYLPTGQDIARGVQTTQSEGTQQGRGQAMQTFQDLLP